MARGTVSGYIDLVYIDLVYGRVLGQKKTNFQKVYQALNVTWTISNPQKNYKIA